MRDFPPFAQQTKYVFEGFKIILVGAGGATLLKIEEYYYCPFVVTTGIYVSKRRLSFRFRSRARGVLMIMWQCTGEEGTLPKRSKMYKRVDVDAFVGRILKYNQHQQQQRIGIASKA